VYTLMSRRREVWGAEGLIESSLDEVTWDQVKGIRLEWLDRTDRFYVADRWDLLSSTRKGQLNSFRSALRDITQHPDANTAADNMPDAQEWFMDA